MSHSFVKVGIASPSDIRKLEEGGDVKKRQDQQFYGTLTTELRKSERLPLLARKKRLLAIINQGIQKMISELGIKKMSKDKPKNVKETIKKAQKSPSTVMTGQGVLDFSQKAQDEGVRQRPQVPVTETDAMARIRKERDELLNLVATGAPGQDMQAMKAKIGDLTVRLKMMEAQNNPMPFSRGNK
jgi:hypothetical protein